jgi:hypothetical protein
MKKTKTENGYELENEKFIIAVFYEYSFGKKRCEYIVTNKETSKDFYPKTLKEAKELTK